jgi:hypothetical protein
VDRRTRTLFAALFGAVVIATGLAAILLSGSPPPTSTAPPGTSEMTGVVVAVDSAGLGNVRGFTLRRPGGELVDFDLRALENAAQFPPGHLAEHQATAAPVNVWYRMDGADRLAIRLEDAPR